jgi:hypothetical protein
MSIDFNMFTLLSQQKTVQSFSELEYMVGVIFRRQLPRPDLQGRGTLCMLWAGQFVFFTMLWRYAKQRF